MKKMKQLSDSNTFSEAFLELVRAGLWEKEARLSLFGELDYEEVIRLAEEQSVVGLVIAGIEQVKDVKIQQEVVLQLIGSALQIEQRNNEMNAFIPNLFRKLQLGGVDALLVKGQGVAQCYEKPLWRTSGDIDLLLDSENYEKAKKVLIPIAYDIEQEDVYKKHQALKIMGVEVELHGRMPFGLSKNADEVVDDVIEKALREHASLELDKTVAVPSIDEHVFLVFTHFLRHFFIEGVGLRQICDWCRLLWTYRNSLNHGLLESRIRRAGLMSEWLAFAALAVDYLGMPVETMPFYDLRFKTKGSRILKRVMKSGNFGHNNDLSYRSKFKGLAYKLVATWRRFVDFVSLMPVFPLDAPRFFVGYLKNKV